MRSRHDRAPLPAYLGSRGGGAVDAYLRCSGATWASGNRILVSLDLASMRRRIGCNNQHSQHPSAWLSSQQSGLISHTASSPTLVAANIGRSALGLPASRERIEERRVSIAALLNAPFIIREWNQQKLRAADSLYPRVFT